MQGRRLRLGRFEGLPGTGGAAGWECRVGWFVLVWVGVGELTVQMEGYRVGKFVLGRLAVRFERLQGRYRVGQLVLVDLRGRYTI